MILFDKYSKNSVISQLIPVYCEILREVIFNEPPTSLSLKNDTPSLDCCKDKLYSKGR